LPKGSLDQSSFAEQKATTRAAHSSRQQRQAGRGSYNSQRGRYARAVVTASSGASKLALDATLRAAAQKAVGVVHGPSADENKASQTTLGPSLPLLIDKGALRYKQFKRKTGTLFIFAVDASGSMALNRIGQAKGALARLLQQSYVRRDRVALVSFRGQAAELLLPPCRSVARARRMLDALPVGGATPLSAGISTAIEVARRAARQGTQEIVLLLFTDGGANVCLRPEEAFDRATRRRVIAEELALSGAALRRAGVKVVVVDTQNRFVSGGEARRLAATLGGRHVSLSSNSIPAQYSVTA
jgi:magnesium chelatase subunit D